MAVKQDIANDSVGIGDIRDILHNQGSVADLSWLEVNEETYRALEALPRQNFDIIPELTRALCQEPDESVPQIIPLRPHTIVNTNPIKNIERIVDELPVRNRVARLVMQGLSPKEIGHNLRLEFDENSLRTHVAAIKETLDEKGLLGQVYVDSKHFPRCAQSTTEDKSFVNKHGKRALYVLAKEDCSNCLHCSNNRCGVFQKRLVASVPYDEKTFSNYASQFEAEGRNYEIVGDVRSRLRQAFSGPTRVRHADPVLTVRTQHIEKSKVSADQVRNFVNQTSTSVKMPDAAYMKYAAKIMHGLNDISQLSEAKDPIVRSLSAEVGLLGHTYLDSDALGGCRHTLAFMKERGISPNFVIRRSASCGLCKDHCDGACAEIRKTSKIVQSKLAINKGHFLAALERAMEQGCLSTEKARLASKNIKEGLPWSRLTAQLNLLKPEIVEKIYDQSSNNFFYGSYSAKSDPIEIDADEVQKFVSQLMNNGLYGKSLISAIQNRYLKSDLVQVPQIGRIASENNGIQGHYFVDPTAYDDYGKGCVVGSKLFKGKSVPYVLASSKCTGCNCQLIPGKCSKYAKELIRQIPEEIKIATKNRISLKVVQTTPIENPISKYELHNEMDFEPKSLNRSEFEMNLSSSDIGDI